MSPSNIQKPVNAQLASDDLAPAVVSAQPMKAASMSMTDPPHGESNQAMRLRGGCIPLPVSIPCVTTHLYFSETFR